MLASITITGNLAGELECRNLQNGSTVHSGAVYVNSGSKKGTEYVSDLYRITLWNRRDILDNLKLGKGDLVTVIGELTFDRYTPDGGSEVMKPNIKVGAIRVSKRSSNSTATTTANTTKSKSKTPIDDDIPF